MNKHPLVLVAVLAAHSLACGGSDAPPQKPETPAKAPTSTEAPTTGTAPPAEGNATAKPGPCAPAGSKANSKGIGAYCDTAAKCGVDTFCTGDFGAPAGAQFCSKQCAGDAECGEGAYCYKEARGGGCVTLACKPRS